MLEAVLKEQLRGIFAGLESEYVLNIRVSSEHESRGELLGLLEGVAECSERISCRISEGEGLEFTIQKDGQETGIKFCAVPNGHEFSSLLLAILNCDGKGKIYRTRPSGTESRD